MKNKQKYYREDEKSKKNKRYKNINFFFQIKSEREKKKGRMKKKMFYKIDGNVVKRKAIKVKKKEREERKER